MSTDQPEIPDDALLGDLRRTLDAIDPPPTDMVALGSAVFGMRRLDDELAELIADSRDDALAVRDTVGLERMLSFTAGAVSIDVQLTPSGDGSVDLLGEIDPLPRGARVQVEQLGSDSPREETPDAGGRFSVSLPAVGAARIRLLRPGGPAVISPWFGLA